MFAVVLKRDVDKKFLIIDKQWESFPPDVMEITWRVSEVKIHD